MTTQVLTDAELTACVPKPARWAVLESESGVPCRVVSNIFEYGRAVEQAVLAKITRRRDELSYPTTPGEIKEYLHSLHKGCVTERDARKRERAAYMFGWLDCPATGIQSITEWQARRERDKRFPLPTKRVPRTVTLSCGLTIERRSDGWTAYDGSSSGHFGEKPPYGLCDNPADARLLADLVERPYEEVPDGEG